LNGILSHQGDFVVGACLYLIFGTPCIYTSIACAVSAISAKYRGVIIEKPRADVRMCLERLNECDVACGLVMSPGCWDNNSEHIVRSVATGRRPSNCGIMRSMRLRVWQLVVYLGANVLNRTGGYIGTSTF